MAFPTTTKIYSDNTNATLTFTSAMNGEKVTFLAFLTSFDQNFTSDWNQQMVYGRNDPIATFQSTKRNLNIGWDVPAGTSEEAESNLDNCSTLAKMVYPYYSESQLSGGGDVVNPIGSNALTISKAPLIRIKFANLITDSSGEKDDGLLGYITSLSWKPVLDMGFFGDGFNFYPKVISLSVSFGVLHEHALGDVGGDLFPTAPGFPFGGE